MHAVAMARRKQRCRRRRQLRKERQAGVKRVPAAVGEGVGGTAKAGVRFQEDHQKAVGDRQQRRRAQAPSTRAGDDAVGGGGEGRAPRRPTDGVRAGALGGRGGRCSRHARRRQAGTGSGARRLRGGHGQRCQQRLRPAETARRPPGLLRPAQTDPCGCREGRSSFVASAIAM